MKTIIVALIVGVLAGVGGYFAGNSGNTSVTDSKRLQDSVTMMKEQSTAIKKMSEMMKSAGDMMQTLGTQYKDDSAIMTGKDLSTAAAKYLKEDGSSSSGAMKEMMN